MVFVYMITAAAQIALRRRRERNGEAAPAVSMWLFPYLSYATIACMVAVLIAMAFTPGQRQDFNVSCITLVGGRVAYLDRAASAAAAGRAGARRLTRCAGPLERSVFRPFRACQAKKI